MTEARAPNRHAGGPPCPICGKPSGPTARPFCSKRCADIDLLHWLSGRYAIPVVDDPEPPEDDLRPDRNPES